MSAGQCARIDLTSQVRPVESEWWFTSAAEKFMKLGVSTVDDATIDKLGEITQNINKLKPNIWEILKGNSFVIGITVVLLLIALGLIIATIVMCIKRWICPKTQGIQPTKPGMVCVLISYGLCAASGIGVVVLFSTSLSHTINGVNAIPDQLNSTAMDIGTLVKNFGVGTTCFFESHTTETINKVNVQLERVKSVADDIEDKLLRTDILERLVASITNYKNTWTNIEQNLRRITQGSSLMPSNMGSLIEKLNVASGDVNRIKADMAGFKAKLTQARTESTKTQDVMKKKLESVGNAIKKGTAGVSTEVEKIKKTIQETIKEIPFEQFAVWLYFLNAIPLLLVAVLLFAIVILAIRFLFSCGADALDPLHPKRGWISVVAGNIIGVGGYGSMIIGAVAFILAAAFFVIGFILMFVCVNSFEDEEVRIFKFVPQVGYEAKLGEAQFNISIHDLFVKCRNEYSFVESIDATELLAKTILEKEIKAIRNNVFAKGIRRYSPPIDTAKVIDEAKSNISTAFTTMKSSMHQFLHSQAVRNELNKLETATNGLTGSITEVQGLITIIESRSRRDAWAEKIEDCQENLEDSLVKAMAGFLDQMIDQSPQCAPIMKIWEDIGYTLCHRLMVPVQGMWLAFVICGFSSFTVINSLFKGTLYLKNFAPPSAENHAAGERPEGGRDPMVKPMQPEIVPLLPANGMAKNEAAEKKSQKSRKSKKSQKSQKDLSDPMIEPAQTEPNAAVPEKKQKSEKSRKSQKEDDSRKSKKFEKSQHSRKSQKSPKSG